MTWVKQNYDRFMLAVFATALIVCAFLLFNSARSFNSVFDSLKDQVHKKDTLPVKINEQDVAKQQQKLADPDVWGVRTINDHRLPLFVSVPYIQKGEILVDPLDLGGAPLHPPVPNAWFLQNKQDLLAVNALDIDTDDDGFSALDEYLGHTDPTDPKSHPPYYTKLFLARIVRIPFRLRFDAKTGDTIQINTLDVDAPTQFLKVGAAVAGTKFKITKFEEKHRVESGINKDVSEVTLENAESGEKIVLPKQQEVDSPTTYALLSYLWKNNKPIQAFKSKEFVLPPDNVKYLCKELTDGDVTLIKQDDKTEVHVKPAPPATH